MVEERVAVLEANVEHIKSDVSETKAEVKRLSAKVDAVEEKLGAKIDAVDQKFTNKIDTLNQKFDDFRVSMEKGFGELGLRIADLKTGRAYDRVWWLLISAALLGVIAKASKWL